MVDGTVVDTEVLEISIPRPSNAKERETKKITYIRTAVNL
jgi:hypothetical protein